MTNHPLVVWIGVACGVFVAGYKAGQFMAGRSVDAEVETILKGWEFSSPLYEKIPGDIDFIAREIRVERDNGGDVKVHLPNGEFFQLQVSAVREVQENEYEIAFGIVGQMGTNTILNPIPNATTIPVARNAISGPISVASHEFFVHIDEVTLDYITVSIARRAVPEIGGMQNVLMIDGTGPTFVGRRPAPVIGTTLEERRAKSRRRLP